MDVKEKKTVWMAVLCLEVGGRQTRVCEGSAATAAAAGGSCSVRPVGQQPCWHLEAP